MNFYVCTCSKCGKREFVSREPNKGIYNLAQAVRSLRWSFGQNKAIKCDICRRMEYNDRYRDR